MNDNLVKLLDKYNMESIHGCCETGYDDKPVILANWNNIPQKVYDALEGMGFSCEWEDEWAMCGECYKAVRTSPNSYGWTQYWAIIGECHLVCGDCIKESPDEYLEGLENHPTNCATIDLDLASLGYELVKDGFENGFHQGQNDDPKAILAELLKHDPSGRYIFNLDGKGQFDLEFSVYRKVEVAR